MWHIYLSELIGTFIFLTVILVTGEAIPIGLTLAAVILFAGKVSGGHFNILVTLVNFLKGDLDFMSMSGYMFAQVLGAVLALVWYKSAYGKKMRGA